MYLLQIDHFMTFDKCASHSRVGAAICGEVRLNTLAQGAVDAARGVEMIGWACVHIKLIFGAQS